MRIFALLYDGWEIQDVQAPFAILAKAASLAGQNDAHFAVVGEPSPNKRLPQPRTTLESLTHFPVVPDFNFDNCPQVDVLIIPGGMGSFLEVKNARIVSFLQKQASSAKFVTSVCTGSSLLAVAGLLDGKRATTNKILFEQQTWYSKKKTEWVWNARWVHEEGSNIITASGVSAGQDMGIYLAGLLFGQHVRDSLCVSLKYPAPLTQSEDPFAGILKRDWSFGKKISWKVMELLLPFVIPMSIGHETPGMKTRGHFITFLGPGWDALDVAGVLEAASSPHLSYQINLISLNDVETLVKGGDSESDFLNQFINVQCDKVVDWADNETKNIAADDLPVYFAFVPSLPPSQFDLARRVVTKLQTLLDKGKIGRILTCGNTILRQVEVNLKLKFDQCPSVSDKAGTWGKFSDSWFHAETGVSGIPAFFTFVKEVAGTNVVIERAKEMELDEKLLPAGIHF
ncbi:hypothetical protein HK100_009791 [Physocladia obscura]|uniref:DJ-1/PfpI domain-containing protein n=1 Tax=Physocladia obscura TaxID=109957 RepID=A0AAD5T5Q8_9FUNG|nr:hypothetical protein HK100_009791 [Physocladia obscura]